MMYLFIDRMTEELGKTYGFNEEQLHQTRAVERRIYAWLNEHRHEIQQLTNEYFKPCWKTNRPTLNSSPAGHNACCPGRQFAERCETVSEQIRPFLTEDQRLTLVGQLASFRVGMKYLNQRSGWAEGGFDARNRVASQPRRKGRERETDRWPRARGESRPRQRAKSTGEPARDGDAAGPPRRPSAVSSRPAGDDWESTSRTSSAATSLTPSNGLRPTSTAHAPGAARSFPARNANELEKARQAAANPRSEAQRNSRGTVAAPESAAGQHVHAAQGKARFDPHAQAAGGSRQQGRSAGQNSRRFSRRQSR